MMLLSSFSKWHILHGLFTALAFLHPSLQAAAQAPEIIEVKRIWDAAPHNAFTDLIRFEDQWYCTFREGEGHVGGDGEIRVLRSADGVAWESAALIEETGIDLRDPKFSVTPDGRLMMLCGGSVYNGGTQRLGMQPRVAFSNDGTNWSSTRRILAEGEWLWRVIWHDGVAYGASYREPQPDNPYTASLVRSYDGIHWEKLTDWEVTGWANEAGMQFLPDGTLMVLLRRDAEDKFGYIGTAKQPFNRWKWNPTRYQLGGPQFIQLPDNALWAGSRAYGDTQTTILAKVNETSLEPILTLPSGGDCSYPGMVWHDGEIWMSYYSSHEGKSSIYLARIAVPLQSPAARK